MSKTNKNDWIAINLNAPDGMTIDALPLYGITSDNTGIQSEDFYKNKKQVLNSDLFKNEDGSFNDEKFHNFYESALRTFNEFQNINFTEELINSIERTAYDVFSPFESPRFDDTAYLYEVRDPRRTTHGLSNIFETGSPVFDEREVAQANNMRDENGNILDWTPNEKGGLLKGLFRPAAAMAIYENDEFDENGKLLHHKGEYKLDDDGNPFYQLLGNNNIAGRETLKYWDTITDDDSPWNKIDFMDSDGLTKSIGGTIMKTATTLLPYFIPGVGEVLGYVGASVALGQALPILGKALDSIVTGTTDNNFGSLMNYTGNWFDRFNSSQSRDVKGTFWSFENIGDIISSSAGQLFQQRNVANLAKTLFYKSDPRKAAVLGRGLSYGYMAVTSGEEAFNKFKEAGADDATAGIATLATMGAFYGLFNINYFKKFLFTNTFMDEDIALTDTVNKLVKTNAVEAYETFAKEYGKKNLSELGKRLERIKLYTDLRDKIKLGLEKIASTPRPTIKETLEANSGTGISFGQRLGMYLTRAANEGFEETMEEVMMDATKGITLGLDAMGINVTEEGKELDFGLSIRDMASRYMQSFVGGFIGGAVFEGFNHWEGGTYDSLLEKDLDERLTWYYRNGYGDEVEDRLKRLYKRGKLANPNLSAKPLKTKNVLNSDGSSKEIIVFGQSENGDSQNDAVYNIIKLYLEGLKESLNNNGLFTDDNTIFKEMYEKVKENSKVDDEDDPRLRLYHFLKDYDTAKAKTIQQMGFLKLISADVTSYAHKILEKDREIENEKANIRKTNHLTDTDNAKEKELFSKSEYLKRLEEEKKEFKEAYDSIINGERIGYYMGLAHMQANPKYKIYYENPSFIKDQILKGFPKTELENYVAVVTDGLDYNSITDERLKKKLEDDFDAFKQLNKSNQLRALYELHLKYSKQFAPDIIAQNTEFEGWKKVSPIKFIRDFVGKYASDSGDILLQNAITTFDNSLEDAESLEDENAKKEAINLAANILTLSVFSNPITINTNTASGEQIQETIAQDVDSAKAILFLKDLAQATVDTKAIIDLSPIRKFVVSNLIKYNDALIASKMKLGYTPLDFYFDQDFDRYDEKNELPGLDKNESIEWLQNRLSQDAVDFILSDVIKKYGEDFDGGRVSTIFEEYKEKYFGLLNGGSAQRASLQNKIDTLKKAIIDGEINVGEQQNAILNYITLNSPYDKNKALEILNALINPIGYDLVKYTKEYRAIIDQQKTNPVLNILSKFNISQGGQLFNVIKMIETEEAFRNQNEEEYKFTKPEIKEQLNTALSFLGVVTAILDSTFDGMNEEINLSSEDQLAVTDDSLKDIYEDGVNTLINRIYALIDLANKNQQKTTVAQQKTDINTKRERIKTLTTIGQINFGNNQVVDFDKIWREIGYSLPDASIETAIQFSEAYDKFVSEIAKQLRSIFNEKLAKKHNVEFIDAIINTFGEDVYLQDPGEISPEPEITPYGNVTWLLTQVILDPDEGNSLWKTVTESNPQLIPLFGQEHAAKESIAHIIDSIEGLNLFDDFHQRLKDKFPESKTYNKAFVKTMTAAPRYLNIDGLAGVGKTQGVAFLAQEMLRLKYNDTVSFAMSKTKESTDGLKEALNQKKVLSVNGMTFDEFVAAITDSGKLFDLSKAVQILNGNKVFKNVDDNGNSVENISINKIQQTLGNGKVILFLDESGLIDRVQAGFLLALANKGKFFIVGSGDVYQNQAISDNGKQSTGFEDFFYHKIAPLTVSMRAEYNGQYNNTNNAKDILKEVFKQVSVKVGPNIEHYNSAIKNVLLNREPKLEFFYAPSNFAGTQAIKSDSVDDIVSQMSTLVDKLKQSNPDKSHKIAILVGDNDRKNKYDSVYGSNDDIEIIYANRVQGREFDYVIVDKSFNMDSIYFAFKDFYTMLTRAKIGSAFVDDVDLLKSSFNIIFTPNEVAAAPVMGGTSEQKRIIFENYVNWKKTLMEKYPLYIKSTTTKQKPIVKTPVEQIYQRKQTFEVFGQGDVTEEVRQKLEEVRQDRQERNKLYTQRLRNGETVHFFERKQLLARDNELAGKSPNLIDFDIFIEELKNVETPTFEKLPGCIFKDTENINSRIQYRSIIATIARGILSTTSEDERIKYFLDAGPALSEFSNQAFLPNNFVTSLQESISKNGNGVLLAYGEYMYYGFTINGNDYLIPIYKLQTPVNSIEFYSKDAKFTTVVSDIPVSTEGEMRFDFNEIFNTIDGFVRSDKSGAIQLAVATPNKALRTVLDDNVKSHTNDDALELIRYINDDSGKAFVSIASSSPSWRTFENTFSLLLGKNKYIQSLVNKLYDNNVVQPFTTIALQKDITFDKWISLIAPLYKLASSSQDVKLSEQESSALFEWFGENVEDAFNKTTSEHRENNAVKFQKLKDYKVLHMKSIESFTSALIRYIQTLEEGHPLRSRFNENFTKWFGTDSSNRSENQEERNYFKGFVVRIVTNKESGGKAYHNFRILPTWEGGYTIDYVGDLNNYEVSKLIDSENKVASLFKGANYDFLNVIKDVLNQVRGLSIHVNDSDISLEELVSSVINTEGDVSNDTFKSGGIQLFPINAYTADGGDRILNYWSPLETEIYKWLAFKDKRFVGIENVEEIDKFLKNDSEFKYGLFAEVKAAINDENKDVKMWSKSLELISNIKGKYSVDITKIIAPLFKSSLGESVILNSNDKYSVLNSRFGKLLELKESTSSFKPAISINQVSMSIENGTANFKEDFTVNKAWLNKYIPDLETSELDIYKIQSINLLTGKFIINGEPVIIELSQLKNIVDSIGEDLQEYFNSIIQLQNARILGNTIALIADNSISVLPFEILGYNSNTNKILARVGKDWMEFTVTDGQLDNLLKYSESAIDNYLTFYDDLGQKVAVYSENGQYYIYDHESGSRLNRVERSWIADKIPGNKLQLDNTDISCIKSYTNNKITLFVGQNTVSSNVLGSWTNNPVSDGYYTLLGRVGNDLYVYQNSLEDAIVIKLNNDTLDTKLNKESSGTADLISTLFDLGIDKNTISELIKNNKSNNPIDFVNYIIKKYNELQRNTYENDLSNSEPLRQLSFVNNNFELNESIDTTVEFKRLVFKALNDKYGSISDIMWLYSGSSINELGVQFNFNGTTVQKNYRILEGKAVEVDKTVQSTNSIVNTLKEQLLSEAKQFESMQKGSISEDEYNTLLKEINIRKIKTSILDDIENYLSNAAKGQGNSQTYKNLMVSIKENFENWKELLSYIKNKLNC